MPKSGTVHNSYALLLGISICKHKITHKSDFSDLSPVANFTLKTKSKSEQLHFYFWQTHSKTHNATDQNSLQDHLSKKNNNKAGQNEQRKRLQCWVMNFLIYSNGWWWLRDSTKMKWTTICTMWTQLEFIEKANFSTEKHTKTSSRKQCLLCGQAFI